LTDLSLVLFGFSAVCCLAPLTALTRLQRLHLSLSCGQGSAVSTEPLTHLTSLHEIFLVGSSSPASTCYNVQPLTAMCTAQSNRVFKTECTTSSSNTSSSSAAAGTPIHCLILRRCLP
jgi:hypothetical protein